MCENNHEASIGGESRRGTTEMRGYIPSSYATFDFRLSPPCRLASSTSSVLVRSIPLGANGVAHSIIEILRQAI